MCKQRNFPRKVSSKQVKTISAFLILILTVGYLAYYFGVQANPSNSYTSISTDVNVAGMLNVSTIYATTLDQLVNGSGVKILRLIIQNGTSFPMSHVTSQLFLRTDYNVLYYSNGSSWVAIGFRHYDNLTGTPFSNLTTQIDSTISKYYVYAYTTEVKFAEIFGQGAAYYVQAGNGDAHVNMEIIIDGTIVWTIASNVAKTIVIMFNASLKIQATNIGPSTYHSSAATLKGNYGS